MAEPGDGVRGARAGLLEAVWHRKLVVIASVLAVAGAALVVSLREQPRYEATASFLVEPREGEVSPTEVIELASADRVAARTADRVGDVDASFVAANVSVEQQGGSDVFTVRGTATGDADGPTLAADLATDFTEEFVDYTSRLDDAFDGRAEVVSAAEPPDDPVSPRTVRNTLLGALAGLVLGIVVAFAWERVDHRVRAARELDLILGVPLLARIPKSPALELDSALRELPTADAEHFQMARVSVRYLDLDRELRTVLITSPDAGDGKTTVAFCLALVAATSGERVLVIEADMRRPGLAVLAEPSPAGLSGVLEGRASFDDERVSVEVSAGAGGTAVVDLLLAGPAPANPTRLFESAAMTELLDDVSEEYDLVVIDTPPVSFLPDAVPLVGHVDGVVIVGGLGRDKWDQIEELRDHLGDLDAPVIGAIANFARSPDESYFRYILDHEAAVAEAGTVPLRPAGAERPARRARRARRRRRRPVVRTVVPEAGAAEPDGAVDLNAASYDDLRGLDLTITQAKRVIAYRERSGGFSSLDQLDDVPGFPDEVRAELKRRVTL